MKRVSDLTDLELESCVNSITTFYDFSFFGERGVDVSMGLTFALEQAACMMGLVGDHLYDDEDYDTAQMMEEFVTALDKKANECHVLMWRAFRLDLPYCSSVCADD